MTTSSNLLRTLRRGFASAIVCGALIAGTTTITAGTASAQTPTSTTSSSTTGVAVAVTGRGGIPITTKPAPVLGMSPGKPGEVRASTVPDGAEEGVVGTGETGADTEGNMPTDDGTVAPGGVGTDAAPTTTATTPEGGLRDRYASLSTSLVAMYAQQTNQPLDAFLAQNSAELGVVFGSNAAKAVGSSDLFTLNRSLGGSGFDAQLSSIGEQGQSIDAAVVSAGANWAAQLGAIRAPELNAPSAPKMDTAAASAMPTESLAFGLFLDKSLTAMVVDFPDVFAQVRNSGVGTAASKAAWDQSMMTALSASRPDFTAMLPSPCHSVMLTAMASGDAGQARTATNGAGGCGGCLATGLYMNSQMGRLFNPQATSTQVNPADSMVPPAEWNHMQGWQKNAILDQNPDLAAGLRASLRAGDGVADCSATSTATGAASRVALPGVFAQLND